MGINTSIDKIKSYIEMVDKSARAFNDETNKVLQSQRALKEGIQKLLEEANKDMEGINRDLSKAQEIINHNNSVYNSISKEVDNIQSRAKNEKNSSVSLSLLKQSETKLKEMERIMAKNNELNKVVQELNQEKATYQEYISRFPKDDGSNLASRVQSLNSEIKEIAEKYIKIGEKAISYVDTLKSRLESAGSGNVDNVNISDARALDNMADALSKARSIIDINWDSFNRNAQAFRNVSQDQISRATVNMVRDSHHQLSMATADMDAVASCLCDASRAVHDYEGLKA